MMHSSLTMIFHEHPRVVELKGTMPMDAMSGVNIVAAAWCKTTRKLLMMRPWPGTFCILGTSRELARWEWERAS